MCAAAIQLNASEDPDRNLALDRVAEVRQRALSPANRRADVDAKELM